MVDLPLGTWIVLALVDEAPTHGFAVAALTAEGAEIGRAWAIPRPLVYRSIDRLTELGLVAARSTEAGARGPVRSIVASTPAGHAAAADWLDRPVTHVRDMRSELLVKIALRMRRALGLGPLIVAQRAVLTDVHAALDQQRRTADGFGRVLLSWRTENAQAALRFLDDLDDLDD
ncbi:PadR family transcriptional regulator, regulatory protein AphA [Asanoa hainanensis]|uniref:PadR family transcriptional regulator, regulatory protein AphA n=1 Tax=Asanoa hainanensis TaxID=560556 RepID=A0A239P998_9ACTN|nr:PadR family transcriptional regulator [Asanoa hainanensis]SNT63630.1 PadR family transcriptional regulator, regulatory protein AphA [Asanoa hainanensis]